MATESVRAAVKFSHFQVVINLREGQSAWAGNSATRTQKADEGHELMPRQLVVE